MTAAAAARNGARTLLIERHNRLGGSSTSGSVGPMMTFSDGLSRQVIAGWPRRSWTGSVALDALAGPHSRHLRLHSHHHPFDPEALKLVAQQLVLEAGAQVLLQTWITGVLQEGQAVNGLEVENKGGRSTLRAAWSSTPPATRMWRPRAGAPFVVGRPADGLTQPGQPDVPRHRLRSRSLALRARTS